MTQLIPESLISTRIIAKDHPINFATIIRADNVAAYIWELKGNYYVGTGFDSSQLTNIAPPLDTMFIQFKMFARDFGILLQSKRVHDYGIEWLTTGSLWFLSEEQRRFMDKPFFTWSIPIDIEGHFESVESDTSDEQLLSELDAATNNESSPTFEYLIYCALFVVNMMHCKNVKLEEQPLTSREKRMQKHDKPAYRYHLLKVKSGHPIFGEGKGKRENYSAHIVRGHFKTFTDDAPLMGRFVGTYWWDAQVRGRDKDHVVDKDYAITDDEIKAQQSAKLEGDV